MVPDGDRQIRPLGPTFVARSAAHGKARFRMVRSFDGRPRATPILCSDQSAECRRQLGSCPAHPWGVPPINREVRVSAASVTEPASAADMSWVRVLEHHASRTPDKPLAVFGDQTVTY